MVAYKADENNSTDKERLATKINNTITSYLSFFFFHSFLLPCFSFFDKLQKSEIVTKEISSVSSRWKRTFWSPNGPNFAIETSNSLQEFWFEFKNCSKKTVLYEFKPFPGCFARIFGRTFEKIFALNFLLCRVCLPYKSCVKGSLQ